MAGKHEPSITEVLSKHFGKTVYYITMIGNGMIVAHFGNRRYLSSKETISTAKLKRLIKEYSDDVSK